MIRFDILTLFPKVFESPFSETILARAISKNLISVGIRNIRDFSADKHHTADDVPYGGGAGMVMKPEPIVGALEGVVLSGRKMRKIYFSPQGRPLRQKNLKGYLDYDQLVLLCGRYEGVDERVIEYYIDEEISIGDYVLSGGEFAAMVFVEAVSRLVPGVLGSEESLVQESFSSAPLGGASHGSPLLEYPQYTRPPDFRGHGVPEILLSGDHKKIEAWRREQALLRTKKKRPDLLK